LQVVRMGFGSNEGIGNMTELLQRAIAEIEKLPTDAQDAIATRILTDLKDEQAWAGRFTATTDEHWDRLVEKIRREIAAGGTASLDDVFPPVVSRAGSRVPQRSFGSGSVDFL
jgi:hypothetical protein